MEHRRGDAVLRRRTDGALELRVNGVFVMDDVETGSERLLATTALSPVRTPRRVLVGGLGLGYTLRALLDDTRLGHVLVAELEPAIPGWMRDGVLPGADLLDDPRVELRLADVREVVADAVPASLDAILLDVDNGPDFLVHEDNATLYETPFLRQCADALGPYGQLCVWSMSEAPALTEAMRPVFARVEAESVPVRLQGRDESYWLLRGHL
ncbi:MAG: spermidine synthase [Nocardioidaceae bacterium]